MNPKKLISLSDFSVESKYLSQMRKDAENFVKTLTEGIRNTRVNAEVFIGGSFSKNTIMMGSEYDIDIFVRFDWKYEDLSFYLEKIISSSGLKKEGFKIEKVHGSRDYFKIYKDRGMTFEVIPVLKIKKPREARNVTDLSYFHVKYVRNRLKGNLIKEAIKAKRFFKSNGIYGAESYINGFSGYSLECLIIYYKSLYNLLRKLSESDKKVIIDIEKKYKRKEDILVEMNESKISGPVVLVDPTWKERNVLAALSKETFDKFKLIAKSFLKNPRAEYFQTKDIDVEGMKKNAKRKKGEFIAVEVQTDRQEGDIAGTKLKKFSEFLSREMGKYFEIIEKEFYYGFEKKAVIYMVVRKKAKIVKIGPEISRKENVREFKKKNRKTYVKGGRIYSYLEIEESPEKFILNWKEKNIGIIKEMGITGLNIKN